MSKLNRELLSDDALESIVGGAMNVSFGGDSTITVTLDPGDDAMKALSTLTFPFGLQLDGESIGIPAEAAKQMGTTGPRVFSCHYTIVWPSIHIDSYTVS